MAGRTGKTRVEVKLTRLRAGGVEEIHVWAATQGGCSVCDCATALYGAIARELPSPATLCIVAERAFGRLPEKRAVLSARADALRDAGLDPDVPVTYFQCAPIAGASPAGVEMTLVRAAKGVSVTPVLDPSTGSGPGDGTRVCGFRVSKGRITRAYLSAMNGLGARTPGSPREQARRMFLRAKAALESGGLSYRNVVCTRIYVKRLLDWYGDFNAVRNRFFREEGIGCKPFSVPTSTGIQGRMSGACECAMDVFALSRGRTTRSPFERLSNPLQNEATAYGSSFARAARVALGGGSLVILAGTASIDESGRSVHVGDAAKQARRTMENFEAIARSGGARMRDLYEAVWYCKDPSHAAGVRREMRRRGWPRAPFIFVVADVCRDDLLVEIDGAALLSGK